MEFGVLSVKCGLWNVECEVWDWEVWSVECDVRRVKCGVWRLECEVVLGSALCKLCSTKWYWEVLCARFVVQSSTENYSVQDFQYKVLL